MNQFEKIDEYFNSKRTNEQQKSFEQQVLNNPDFADEVAFYIKTKAVLSEQYRQQQKLQFKEIYQAQKQQHPSNLKIVLFRRIAVAASITIIVALVSFFWLHQKPTAYSLADTYITKHWQVLSVQMSAEQDSLQRALQLYNNQDPESAIKLLEQILEKNPTNAEALKYAGITYLKMENYNSAIDRFTKLADEKGLKENPGNFYRAVALIKRNSKGDILKARNLLATVISKKMEGEKEARVWMKHI